LHRAATSGELSSFASSFATAGAWNAFGDSERPTPQALDAGRVVGLVVAEGHHELRDARRQGLGCGADAAMMHQCGRARQELAERDVVTVTNAFR
jgi:hypothetical protein